MGVAAMLAVDGVETGVCAWALTALADNRLSAKREADRFTGIPQI